ncbi:MAG: helix-turn-helix transcriptional regulator [Bacilli bacterium]
MDRLKEFRTKYNYSCQFMADKLKISKSFYWQIENDKRRLSYDTAVKISKIFKLRPDNIFYDEFKNKV